MFSWLHISGVAARVEITSEPVSTAPDVYDLSWQVKSYSPIQEYKVAYRRSKVSSNARDMLHGQAGMRARNAHPNEKRQRCLVYAGSKVCVTRRIAGEKSNRQAVENDATKTPATMGSRFSSCQRRVICSHRCHIFPKHNRHAFHR